MRVTNDHRPGTSAAKARRNRARRTAFLMDRSAVAFTLVEVLTAIAIFSLVILSIYSTWNAILRATKVGLDTAASVQRSRVAVKAVEDALFTAQMYGENGRFYSFLSDTKDENFHFLSLTSRLPPTFPGSGMFGDQIVRRVTFEVVPGEGRTNNLVMSQINPYVITNEDITPYPITLVRDCSLFFIEFWNMQKSEWASDWLATNQLPRMMRVTIGWGHSPQNQNEPADIVTRTIALPGAVVMGELNRPQ